MPTPVLQSHRGFVHFSHGSRKRVYQSAQLDTPKCGRFVGALEEHCFRTQWPVGRVLIEARIAVLKSQLLWITPCKIPCGWDSNDAKSPKHVSSVAGSPAGRIGIDKRRSGRGPSAGAREPESRTLTDSVTQQCLCERPVCPRG